MVVVLAAADALGPRAAGADHRASISTRWRRSCSPPRSSWACPTRPNGSWPGTAASMPSATLVALPVHRRLRAALLDACSPATCVVPQVFWFRAVPPHMPSWSPSRILINVGMWLERILIVWNTLSTATAQHVAGLHPDLLGLVLLLGVARLLRASVPGLRASLPVVSMHEVRQLCTRRRRRGMSEGALAGGVRRRRRCSRPRARARDGRHGRARRLHAVRGRRADGGARPRHSRAPPGHAGRRPAGSGLRSTGCNGTARCSTIRSTSAAGRCTAGRPS